MRIASIEPRREDFALTRPYTIAFRSVAQVSNVIVEIRTEPPALGLGAGSPEPHVTGESLATCEAALAAAAPALIGRDVRELPALCRSLQSPLAGAPAARAALDMALHDLYAQHLRLPLVDVLGRAHERLPTSITIGIKNAADTLAEAREYLGRGFRILKVKLGHDVREDIERLELLRAELGAGVGIRVDPNQGYSKDDLELLAAQQPALALEFIEQPLAAAEVASMRARPAELRALLAADESLLGEGDALALACPPQPCAIWNIKLMKCGGIFPARRMGELAEVAGIRLMWGCMDESIISISAALHVALACPATRYLDLDGHLDLARDVVSGGFELRDGMLSTVAAPGLGLARL